MPLLVDQSTNEVLEGVRFNGASTHKREIGEWLTGNGPLPLEPGLHTRDVTSFEIRTANGIQRIEMGDWVIKYDDGKIYKIEKHRIVLSYWFTHDRAFADGCRIAVNSLIPYFQDENENSILTDFSGQDLEAFRTGALGDALNDGVQWYGDKFLKRDRDEAIRQATEYKVRNNPVIMHEIENADGDLVEEDLSDYENRVLANPELVAQLDAGIAAADRGETSPGARRT